MCKILSCINPTVNLDQSCSLTGKKHKHVNTVTTCMLSAFCHCSASLSILVAFWSAHVSLCQNKRIFQPSNQPQEPEPQDEQRDLYHRHWAVAAETGSQTVSHSLPPSQCDSDITQTNIWACWAPRCRQSRHHFMGCCSLMHLPLYVTTVTHFQLAVKLQWWICQSSI